MSASAAMTADQPGASPSSVNRRGRLRRQLSQILLWSSAELLAIMTGLVLFQVFTRYVLGSPAAFTEELVRYALIWLSFVAGAYAFCHREHMAFTILRDRLPERSRRAAIIVVDLLVPLLSLIVLVAGGTMLVISSWQAVSALLGISRGLVYLIVPIAGLAIAAAQVLNLMDDALGEHPLGEGAGIPEEAL